MSQLNFPVYSREKDGNVFDWILKAGQNFRVLRQRERLEALEKAQNDNHRNVIVQPRLK